MRPPGPRPPRLQLRQSGTSAGVGAGLGTGGGGGGGPCSLAPSAAAATEGDSHWAYAPTSVTSRRTPGGPLAATPHTAQPQLQHQQSLPSQQQQRPPGGAGGQGSRQPLGYAGQGPGPGADKRQLLAAGDGGEGAVRVPGSGAAMHWQVGEGEEEEGGLQEESSEERQWRYHGTGGVPLQVRV